ncbi:MAG: hypothetical protein Q4B14_02605 [Clostridia bacterium]|nr:hypothetical protein [Clostridia bacterium]
MEQMLKRLFDYHRFFPDKRLIDIISDVESRYCELDDEELLLVAAAGDTDTTKDLLEKKDEYMYRDIQ